MNAFELYNLAQIGININMNELSHREVLVLQMVAKEIQHKQERESKSRR